MAQTPNTAIAQKQPMSISYKLSNGEMVELNEAAVRKLTNNNQYITTGEISLFLEMCKYQKLNPFVGEAYLVKYDSSKPASKVVSLAAFMRIADEQKSYDGIEDGIIVQNAKGEYIDREGCILYANEKIVGGWANVYRSDRSKPFKSRVQFSEYNKGQAMWLKMPAVMINKVAKVTALRKAFPAAMNGCYIEEETEQPPVVDKMTTTQPEPAEAFDVDFTEGAEIDLTAQDFAETDPPAVEAEPETATGSTKRIPYNEYSLNKSKYEKVEGTYDRASKTIEVIEK